MRCSIGSGCSVSRRGAARQAYFDARERICPRRGHRIVRVRVECEGRVEIRARTNSSQSCGNASFGEFVDGRSTTFHRRAVGAVCVSRFHGLKAYSALNVAVALHRQQVGAFPVGQCDVQRALAGDPLVREDVGTYVHAAQMIIAPIAAYCIEPACKVMRR